MAEFIAAFGSGSWRAAEPAGGPAGELHEAGRLVLDCGKSRDELGWTGVWDTSTAVRRTAAWYRTWAAGAAKPSDAAEPSDVAARRDAAELRGALEADIESYVAAAKALGACWAQALPDARGGRG